MLQKNNKKVDNSAYIRYTVFVELIKKAKL